MIGQFVARCPMFRLTTTGGPSVVASSGAGAAALSECAGATCGAAMLQVMPCSRRRTIKCTPPARGHRCWIADIIEAAKDVADGILDAAEAGVQQVEADGNQALNAAKAALSAAQVCAQP